MLRYNSNILPQSYMNSYSNVKVGLPPSKKNCLISVNESPLKMMKNAYFILKALFVLKIFQFLS